MVPLPAELRAGMSTLDGRLAARRTLHLRVRSSGPSERANAQVHNLSENGLLVETSGQLKVGETLYVDLPEAGLTPAVVIWNRGNHFGCEFVQWIPSSAVSAAILRSSPERLIGEEPWIGESAHRESQPFTPERERRGIGVIAAVVLPFVASVVVALALIILVLNAH
jgi:PilZ domain